MTDAELRGRLLTHFFKLRNNAGGWVPANDMILSGLDYVSLQIIGRICQELADAQLISWKPHSGGNEGFIMGMARITAHGVDVVNGDKASSLEISLPTTDKSLMPNVSTIKSNGQTMTKSSNKIFIVHGHDDAAKLSVERFLKQLDLRPVILHDQPNMGRTLITKFTEESADVNFAVVLVTPDDQGARNGSDSVPRARQNVVFELGFFIGKLGSARVCALVKENVEKPSDFDGVVYVPFVDGSWQRDLARELKAAGYEFDLNKTV